MKYEDLVNGEGEQFLKIQYERIYKGYEHTCTFEDFKLRKQIEEEVNELRKHTN